MIEEFSRGYWLIEADIIPFSGERVTTTRKLGREMLDYSRQPMLKLGGEHWPVDTAKTIPPNTIAVPCDLEPKRNDHALMAKDEVAERVLDAGTN